MAKKIPRKEEEFWRDLAGRMAKHLGYSTKRTEEELGLIAVERRQRWSA